MVSGIGAQSFSGQVIYAQDFSTEEVSVPEDTFIDDTVSNERVSVAEICNDGIDNDGDQGIDDSDLEGCVPQEVGGGGALTTEGAQSTDSDSDGVPDNEDQCPNDPTAWVAPCPASSSSQQFPFTDQDGDTIEDSKDPCIDPNDFMNSCAYANGGATSVGGEKVSSPEEVVSPENAATGNEQEANVCTGNEQEANVCTEGEEYVTDTEEGSQYDENCTNFVEVDCGAVATDDRAALAATEAEGSQKNENCTNFVEVDCGAVATDERESITEGLPIKPEFQHLLEEGDIRTPVFQKTGGVYCNPNSENCHIYPCTIKITDGYVVLGQDGCGVGSRMGKTYETKCSEGGGGVPSEYKKILDKLQQLCLFSYNSNGKFADAVIAIITELERQLKAIPDPSRPIPPSPLAITIEALKLWADDNGNTWGTSDTTADFDPTAECYATVAGDDSKCNIFVAEVIYRATGVTHQAHEETQSETECMSVDNVAAVGCYKIQSPTGYYFPYRAAEWADTSKNIPNFRVDNADPRMGDIWAAITEKNVIFRNVAHAGIYLGEYNGIKLYISARSNGDGVYGLGPVQHENGIQIKELTDPGVSDPKGGVFREYIP
jgi:hypothetical protein